ncbi:hypothetical protein ACTXT7_013598 [Hymenolepis weldensis]
MPLLSSPVAVKFFKEGLLSTSTLSYAREPQAAILAQLIEKSRVVIKNSKLKRCRPDESGAEMK